MTRRGAVIATMTPLDEDSPQNPVRERGNHQEKSTSCLSEASYVRPDGSERTNGSAFGGRGLGVPFL
ncbi:MAG: hypothetical protein ACP5G0_14240 [Desulfomonilia bacterium]